MRGYLGREFRGGPQKPKGKNRRPRKGGESKNSNQILRGRKGKTLLCQRTELRNKSRREEGRKDNAERRSSSWENSRKRFF